MLMALMAVGEGRRSLLEPLVAGQATRARREELSYRQTRMGEDGRDGQVGTRLSIGDDGGLVFRRGFW
jgi:hypothetical protein